MPARHSTVRLPEADMQAEGFGRTRSDHRSEIAEDYVELIADLIDATGEARAVDLASRLGVTNATVAQIFGVAHLSMLGGFVFFSHQIGSFMGVWLGGFLYDRTGSYDIVWYISIALGVFAALINLPVREAPIARGPQRVGVAA